MTKPKFEDDVWEAALADSDVGWCRGPGCPSGASAEQHRRGFRTATLVHLAAAPDPEDREATHRALRLVGRVQAGREAGDAPTREQALAGFDAATEWMRAGGLSVPRPVLDRRADLVVVAAPREPAGAPESPAEPAEAPEVPEDASEAEDEGGRP